MTDSPHSLTLTLGRTAIESIALPVPVSVIETRLHVVVLTASVGTWLIVKDRLQRAAAKHSTRTDVKLACKAAARRIGEAVANARTGGTP